MLLEKPDKRFQRAKMKKSLGKTETLFLNSWAGGIPNNMEYSISNLSRGMSVGAVPDNFGEKIDQKIFHVQIMVDNERLPPKRKTTNPSCHHSVSR